MKNYAIGSSGSYEIEEIDAKSLRGAKCIASRTFAQSLNAQIIVYSKQQYPNGEYVFIPKCVKYGYDRAWTDVPA